MMTNTDTSQEYTVQTLLSGPKSTRFEVRLPAALVNELNTRAATLCLDPATMARLSLAVGLLHIKARGWPAAADEVSQ